MKEIRRYYYDRDCKIVEDTQKSNHDEIAREVIQSNPELLEEYKKIREHGVISESVFLVMKGYIYVGDTGKTLSAMFSSISLNPKTKNQLIGMKEEYDCYIYDVIRNELTDEQKHQVKKWHNDKMPRDEIIHRVMTDMIVQLAPTKTSQTDVEIDNEER